MQACMGWTFRCLTAHRVEIPYRHVQQESCVVCVCVVCVLCVCLSLGHVCVVCVSVYLCVCVCVCVLYVCV